MPFLNQITKFINDELKAGSLNKKKLQPTNFIGLSTTIARSKKGSAQNAVEILPAVIDESGKVIPITPDEKYSLQVYHKLLTKVYSIDKKGFGDEYLIKCVSELAMVVFTNGKLTGKAKEVLEPVVLFGIPQRLSTALIADLKIKSCLIYPTASNLDHMQVFGQEFPRSEYFLNEQMSMFSIRYKVETVFSQTCIDQCLCE